MKYNNKKIFILSFILVFFFYINAEAYTFNKDLTTGTTDEDVRQLQIFLNNYSPETKIAEGGVGSPGNETNYFGLLTKQALIKFQNINANTILIPSGINNGTGYLGATTRNLINSYSETKNTSSATQKINTPTNLTDQNLNINSNTDSEYLIISKKIARTKDKIEIGSSSNIYDTDFFLEQKKLNKNCKTDYTCTIVIENINEGDYILSSSNPLLRSESIKIIDSKKPKIKIKTIKLNADNVIKGTNLSKNITIYTPFGLAQTETRNKSFILRIESTATKLPDYLSKGPIYIENEDGSVSDIIITNYEI